MATGVAEIDRIKRGYVVEAVVAGYAIDCILRHPIPLLLVPTAAEAHEVPVSFDKAEVYAGDQGDGQRQNGC